MHKLSVFARTLLFVVTLVCAAGCNTPTSNDMPNMPSSYNGRPVQVQGTIYVSSRDVEFTVWDDGNYIDNDIITLVVNGDTVIEQYSLGGPWAKRTIRTKLDFTGYNYLLLFAHNEGSVPPNTSALSISDGVTNQSIVISASLRTCGGYHIVVR